jgi:hypothetical protein
MKKTSTLKNAVSPSGLREAEGFDPIESTNSMEFEPDAQVISNILNYSKALSVQPSALLQHIVQVNN